MAAYYDSIKTMKVAKIGTIMPWSGDGGSGNLPSNIPKGWIVCDGKTLDAKDYPLLASMIGDTYGGDMTTGSPVFPYVGSSATFFTPPLSNSVMMDLEEVHLTMAEYQYGQSDAAAKLVSEDSTPLKLVKDYGNTNTIKAAWDATADIDFSLTLSGFLYFKIADIKLTNPEFGETVYTMPRKLGMNHTPPHNHTDVLPSTNTKSYGPMTFRTDAGVRNFGSGSDPMSCNYNNNPVQCEMEETNPSSWENGAVKSTFYGDQYHEDTLPSCESFMEYVNDNSGSTENPSPNYWATVPAGKDNWNSHHEGSARTGNTDSDRGSGHAYSDYRQNIFPFEATNQIDQTTPVSSHATKCYTGMFPRPIVRQNRPNFLGYYKDPASAPTNSAGIKNHPEAMTAFEVSGVTIVSGVSEITLPIGTDIRQQYGTSPNQWYQWDKITPLMYVTEKDNKNKFKRLDEGTRIETIRKEGGAYVITLNQPTVGSSTTATLVFRNGSWPMTLNRPEVSKNPLDPAFQNHAHDSFEIQQTGGSMTDGNKILASYTASNANGSSLQAQSMENALNIVCDTSQPNVTMTFLIKAY